MTITETKARTRITRSAGVKCGTCISIQAPYSTVFLNASLSVRGVRLVSIDGYMDKSFVVVDDVIISHLTYKSTNILFYY